MLRLSCQPACVVYIALIQVSCTRFIYFAERRREKKGTVVVMLDTLLTDRSWELADSLIY